MTWLSPAYPVGAFSYSSGIEWAVEAGDVGDAETLRRWIATLLRAGAGMSDGIFFSHAYRAVQRGDDAALVEVAELAAAFVPTRERFYETTAMGRAFLEVTQAAWPCAALRKLKELWSGPVAYPIAVAAACAGHGIPLDPALHAFLTAVAANWISAGRAACSARPHRRSARLAGARRHGRGNGGARLDGAARRARQRGVSRRHRQRQARSAIHTLVSQLRDRTVSSSNGPLRVGIGGPVGSGKTALMDALCKSMRGTYDIAAITNDIYTKWDAEFLVRSGSLAADRIVGVETGGCPHTAIREDASMNLAAVADMRAKFPALDLVLIESGGDNLAATFSPELADLTIYVIDVAGGDKIPSKGGPGITRSDLLVINKVDLAPHVGASLTKMETDAKRMRGARPFVMTNLRAGDGVPTIVDFIETMGGLANW